MDIPKQLYAVTGTDGRHHAVPLMSQDWDDMESRKYPHPRIGHISHGRGCMDVESAEKTAKLVSSAYNSYQKHARNPLEAAEGDMLGKALRALDDARELMIKSHEGRMTFRHTEDFLKSCRSILSQTTLTE